MPQPAAGTAPVKRKTSPIIWVLIILLGLFVLGGVAVVGAGYFFLQKAKQAGVDPDLIQRNPGLAVAKLVAAANPDAEIVKTDEQAGTITIRDRKTGKTITVTFDQAKNGVFRFSADDDGKTATVEIGAGKVPSWVPAYPGAAGTGTFSVKGDSADGSGEGGTFTFTTKDSADQVIGFFQEKMKEMGMKVNLSGGAGQGRMIIATDEAETRSLSVAVAESSGESTVNVTYSRKR
jgi:hypothetical protein